MCGTFLFFLAEILITMHLVGLKLICQVCSHCPSAERSLWRRALSLSISITLYRKLSSANNLVWEDHIDCDRSFMKHKNRSGPSTVPCGTPDMTSTGSDVTPSRATWLLWWRKDSIHFLVWFLIRSSQAYGGVLCGGLCQTPWQSPGG